jgi:hypothetical protein
VAKFWAVTISLAQMIILTAIFPESFNMGEGFSTAGILGTGGGIGTGGGVAFFTAGKGGGFIGKVVACSTTFLEVLFFLTTLLATLVDRGFFGANTAFLFGIFF